ncbi:MAG: HAD family hydrolase [Clostridia bacterium]|nr:HAD family hydrolase [Clostridia bacterium]
MIRAVLFDLDHTLFDRHSTLVACVPYLRSRFHVDPEKSDAEIGRIWCYADDHFVYDGWQYIFAYLVENGVFTDPPKYPEYRSFVYEAYSRVAVKWDWTEDMLKQLRRHKYLLGVITNGSHALQYKKLSMIGLSYIFDEVVVSGDTDFEKPDRELFRYACEKLGVEPEECVYVGDNRKNDVDGAKAAGMLTVWLSSTNPNQSGSTKPDATVKSLKNLPAVIRKLQLETTYHVRETE